MSHEAAPMRTPEQIAADTLAEAGYADWYRPYQEQVRSDIARAIEADRAQHDLQYARTIIDQHDARAVIWERGDVASVLQQQIDEGAVDAPTTREAFDALVDRAMESASWRALDDATDRDWEMIALAIDEASGAQRH